MRIDSSGNVGIGETSPANLLHVKVSDTGVSPHASAQIVLERSGTNYLQFLTANSGTSGILFGDEDDNDVAQIKYDHNVPALIVVTEGTERVRIGSAGNIVATGQIRAGSNTEAAPSLSFSGNSDAGFYTPTDNNIKVVIDGDTKYGFGLSNFFPEDDNSRDLGQASKRWDDVRATNGSIVTSDKNEKNTIVASDLGLDFVNKLTPVSYKFNNKTRTHYGLISQDIETVLGTISKSATDFAGFCKDTITEDADGNALDIPFDIYGLRYQEFLAPMIKAIQELSAKVTALETS